MPQLRRRIGRIQRLKWEALSEESVRAKFADGMKSKFNIIPNDISNVEDEWQLFKLAILSSATESCGLKSVGPAPGGHLRTSWWTKEVQEIVKEKKNAFVKWLNDKSDSNRLVYIRAKKSASEAVKKAKKTSWERFGEEMESNYRSANKIFWQTVRRLRNTKKGSIRVIKDKNGDILREEKSILLRWKEYFDQLLNEGIQTSDTSKELSPVLSKSNLSEEEILQAVKSLKCGKKQVLMR